MKTKTINTREFRLYFRHRRLVAAAAKRGYSSRAIEKLVRAAGESKRH